MRRFIAVILLLLCLPVQLAALPASSAQPAAPEEDGTGPLAAGAYSMGLEPDEPVDADAVLLLDLESGQSLYERGADQRIYPASTTKTMTALCVVNAVEDLDGTEVTVRQDILNTLPTEPISLAGLQAGEKLSVRDLLYCLMLPSGNDAAVVLGDFVGGSLDGFVQLMNDTAQELGCQGTHFVSVNGLSGEEHYSTPRDMAIIAQAVLDDPDLAQIVRTPFYTIKTNVHDQLELENTNHLLDPEHEYYLPEAIGVKTGSSELSGRCIIAAAEKDGMRLMAVIMGAPYLNEYGVIIEPSPAIVEAHKLFTWALSAYARRTLCQQGETFPIELDGVGEAQVCPARTVTAVMPAQPEQDVERVVTAWTGLRAPLKKGEPVGLAQYCCGDTLLGQVELVMGEDLSPIRWWMWPLPAAVLLAVLSLAVWPLRRRPRKPAAPEKPRRAPRRRQEDPWPEDEDDLSPFVEYAAPARKGDKPKQR